MRRIRLVSLADVLGDVDPETGLDGMAAAYQGYHASRPGEDSTAGAIALAYQWLTAGRIAEAVALFEMNARRFESDADAQFHFGEAFRFTGRPGEAAEQYRKTLALEPDHTNAAARLSEVSGTRDD